MRLSVRLALAATLFVVFGALGSAELRAQLFTPFHLQQGYDVALAKARDTLAADAYLVFAGTFGDLDLAQFGFPLPVTLNFYQDDVPRAGLNPAKQAGQADAWGYVFNSPSQGRTMSLVAFRLLGTWNVQGVPVDLPLPALLVDTLDVSQPGTRSDTVMARLKRNDTWRQYHARYPQKQPSFVTLGSGLPQGLQTPPGFEASGPIWSFTYPRSGDTAGMICFVAATSGLTVCRQTTISSAPSADAHPAPALQAAPNPSRDRVRITVAAEALRGEVSLSLLDARGAHVADLTPSLLAGDGRTADVDVSALAPGVYFCRLVAGGTARVVAVSVGAR